MEKKPPVTHTFHVNVLGVEYEATFAVPKDANVKDIEKCARSAFAALNSARLKNPNILANVEYLTKISATGITYQDDEGEKTITYEDLEKLVEETNRTEIYTTANLQDLELADKQQTGLYPSIFPRIQKAYAKAWGAITPADAAKIAETNLKTKVSTEITKFCEEIADLTAKLAQAAIFDKNLPRAKELKKQISEKQAELTKYLNKKGDEAAIKTALKKNHFVEKAREEAYRKAFSIAFKKTLQEEADLLGEGKGVKLSHKMSISTLFDFLVGKGKEPLCVFSEAEDQQIVDHPKIASNCIRLAEETYLLITTSRPLNKESVFAKAVANEHPFLVIGKSVRSSDFTTELQGAVKTLETSRNLRDNAVAAKYAETKKLQVEVLQLSIEVPIKKDKLLQAIKEFNAAKKELIYLLREKEASVTDSFGNTKKYPITQNIAKSQEAILLGLETAGKSYCEFLLTTALPPEQQEFLRYQENQFALHAIDLMHFHGDHHFTDYPTRGSVLKEIRFQDEKKPSEQNPLISQFNQLVLDARASTLSEEFQVLFQNIKDRIYSLISLVRDLVIGTLKPGSTEEKAKLKAIAQVLEEFPKEHSEEIQELVALELDCNVENIGKAKKLENDLSDALVQEFADKGIQQSPEHTKAAVQIVIYTAKMQVLLDKAKAMTPGPAQDRILCLHDELEKRVNQLESDLIKASDAKVPASRVMRMVEASTLRATARGEKEIQSSFDRQVDVHQESARRTKEKALRGNALSTKAEAAARRKTETDLEGKKGDFTTALEMAPRQLASNLAFAIEKAPNKAIGDLEAVCEKTIQETYIKIAEDYLRSIGEDPNQAKALIYRMACAATATALQKLAKSSKGPLQGNLAALSLHYRGLSLEQPPASFKKETRAAKEVEQVVQGLNGIAGTAATDILNLEMQGKYPEAQQRFSDAFLDLHGKLTTELKKKGIRDPQLIEDLTMLMLARAYTDAYQNIPATQKAVLDPIIQATIESSSAYMKGNASQLEIILSDDYLAEAIKNQPAETHAKAPGAPTQEQQRLSARESTMSLSAVSRLATSSKNPLFIVQRELLLNEGADPTDCYLRNYPFASFAIFTQALEEHIIGASPKYPNLVKDTIRTARERAEKFAECERLIQATDITNVEDANKLKKPLEELARLDQREATLKKHWVSLGAGNEDYFNLIRDEAGAASAQKSANSFVQESYVHDAQALPAGNDFQLLRNMYRIPAIASGNPVLEAAKRDYVNAVVRGEILLSFAAHSLANEISKNFPKATNMAASLKQALELQLQPVKRAQVYIDTKRGNQKTGYSITEQMAKEAKSYKVELEKFIKGDLTGKLSSKLISDVGNHANVIKMGGNLGAEEIADSIKVTMLLEQLSIARNLQATTPEERQRKAMVIDILINRLSDQIANSKLSHLPTNAVTFLLKNLDELRKTNSKELPLDKLSESFLREQTLHAMGLKPAPTIDSVLLQLATPQVIAAAKLSVASDLQNLRAMTNISKEGLTFNNLFKLENELEKINDKINDPNTGQLYGILLMNAIREIDEPQVQNLLKPLLVKLNNKIISGMSPSLQGIFAALNLANFPKTSAKPAKPAKANDAYIAAALSLDPKMERAAQGAPANKAEKAKRYAVLLKDFFDIQRALNPEKYKGFLDLIDPKENERLLQAKSKDAVQGNASLKGVYDAVFESAKQNLINNNSDGKDGRDNILFLRETGIKFYKEVYKGEHNTSYILETDGTKTLVRNKETYVSGTGKNTRYYTRDASCADPMPAIYYWIDKANQCAADPIGQQVCCEQITRLLNMLPDDQRAFFEEAAAKGGTKLFSED